MTQYQYFVPCSGEIDSWEHQTYCGCPHQGMGIEVFPKHTKFIDECSVLDLDTNTVLTKRKCEVVSEEEVFEGDCVFCSGIITSIHTTFKKVDGSIHEYYDSYGSCGTCGAI